MSGNFKGNAKSFMKKKEEIMKPQSVQGNILTEKNVIPKVTMKRYQTKRMITLGMLYVYIGIHIVLWYGFDIKPWGKTAMVGVPSLVAGHINAAAIMVLFILGSVFIYGRGFCGWACHVRGAIELADWVMLKIKLSGYKKLRDTNILLNMRYHWLLRYGALYVLLIPVIVYLNRNGFSISYDLMTPPPLSDLANLDNESLRDHFPLNMLSIENNLILYLAFASGSILFILFVMSFVFTYFYGQGAFCRILCPYGVLLVPLMNMSPWQKKITRISNCTGCRRCSNNCPQGIDISREIYHYDGKVTNRECIKCYNCIDICENSTLKDTSVRAVPQTIPVKEYEKKPWLSQERHLQIYEPLGPILDFVSMIFSLISGAAASRLGGFYFFVGAILGFVIIRKATIFLLHMKREELYSGYK